MKQVILKLSHDEEDQLEDVLSYMKKTEGITTTVGLFRHFLAKKYTELLPKITKQREVIANKVAKEIKGIYGNNED